MSSRVPMQMAVRILAVTLALLLLLVAGAWLLPAEWQVERSAVIHAPPAKIFPYLNNLKQWRSWVVWYSGTPDMVVDSEISDAGVGATIRWQEDGERRALKIVRSDSDRRIDYLLLIDAGRSEISGLIVLVPEGDATRVVWRASGVTDGSPLLRYAARLHTLGMGRDLDASLAQLRSKIEAR